MRILFLMFVIVVMFTGVMSEQQASANQDPTSTPASSKTGGMQKILLNTPINSANCTSSGSQVTLRSSVLGGGVRTIVLETKDAPTMNMNIETQADGTAIIRWSDGKSFGDNQMTLAPGQSKTISVVAGCEGMKD